MLKANLKKFFDSTEFKVIFVMLAGLNLIQSYMYSFLFENYGFSLLQTFNNVTYILVLFSLIIFGVFRIIKIFDQNYFFLVRCYSKKRYLLYILLHAGTITILLFTISMIILLIGNNLFLGLSLDNFNYFYEYNSIVYLIFYIIRIILIYLNIIIFSVMLSKIFNNLISLLFFISTILPGYLYFEFHNTFTLLPWAYFGNIYFENFKIDFLFSIIYILILALLNIICFKICINKMSKVGC